VEIESVFQLNIQGVILATQCFGEVMVRFPALFAERPSRLEFES
jgi:hypothetical protein